MRLRLEFSDKYELWSELVKANTDRVFIETTDTAAKLGTRVPVELAVGSVLLVAVADVVGIRTEGGRFKAGVWVRLGDEEVLKVRRFLGLAEEPTRPISGRRDHREPCQLAVTLERPAVPHAAKFRNLSVSGALLETTAALSAGQFLELGVKLDDGTTISLSAEVVRERNDAYLGLRFVDVSEHALAGLRAQLERLVSRPPRARQQILVADDEADLREFLTRALAKHGYEVLEASGGRQAMAIIREERPALVVLDILMPGMDGVDICKTMRADVELAQIPVIFASALEASLLHGIADESGATDFVSKPMTLGDLLNVVGRYLKQ
ncbi:MAG: response regulator [Archangium sp.]|nr:response regulator [Archangium sp.]